MNKLSDERRRYLKEYQKEHLKRIPLDVSKEDYEKIKEYVKNNGESINGFIKRAINMAIEQHSDAKVYAKPEEIVRSVVNDKKKLDSILIPALIESEVNIVDIIKLLLGDFSLGTVADARLIKYYEDIKMSRTLLKLWEARNDGNYTIKDVPEWVYEKLPREKIEEVIIKNSKYSENVYDFTKYHGTVHFTATGYIKMINGMEERRMITPLTADKWKQEVYNNKN